MFDIGFPELVLVSIVALLVIGPERLPETVRTVSLWVGRLRRSMANLKQELEQEIGADDIRRQLHNESIMKDLEETRDQFTAGIAEAERSISELNRNPLETDTTATTEPSQSDPLKSQSADRGV